MSDGYQELASARKHWDDKRDTEIERLRRELKDLLSLQHKALRLPVPQSPSLREKP